MEKKLGDLLEKAWDAATANWCVPGAPDFDEWIEEIETSEKAALNIGDVSVSLPDYDNAEKYLQEEKDIYNHPYLPDRNKSNSYDVADLLVEFANKFINNER